MTALVPATKPPAGPAHLHGLYHDAAGFHPLRARCRGCCQCADKATAKPLLMTHGQVTP